MATISTLLIAWTALLAIPVLVFVLEILAGWRLAPAGRSTAPAPPFAVLMPAHDEAAGIGLVITALRPQLRPGDRLLVVADNCSDDTAAVARQHGAEVVERTDATLRGKGYALDFGVRHLGSHPPDVVIIIDADCVAGECSLRTLAAQCSASHRPTQALYLMRSPGLSVGGRIAEFAWRVKNHARPLGLHRMGLPCQLMGTGMAFPWLLIANAPLASGHIVEDLQLGLDLAMAGTAPEFCPSALVTSQFAANVEGADSQRTRWEHGHMHLLVSRVPGLLWTSMRRGNLGALALAMDLLVPPLALLALLVAATSVASVTLALVHVAFLPAAWSALCVLTLLLAGVGCAWLRHGRDLLSMGDLARVPLYALRKIPIYVRFLVARQVSWIRARRDE
ncbi:MAG: glycosyltransferase family 2 protein [Steroidobacteraceae bacterium]